MTEGQFFSHMRITKEAFRDLIELLKTSTRKYNVGGQGYDQVPLDDALMMALWYLASKTTFREIGNLFGYHSGTVNRLFIRLINVLNSTEALQIKWPDDLQNVSNDFQARSTFPGVVGAIDGTHIKIRPPAVVQKDYNSRKCVHTMVLLAVCDAHKRFTMVATGIPGSVADQRCFGMTRLGQSVKSCPNEFIQSKDFHIIGDSAFALEFNVMKPYIDNGHLTVDEVRFNQRLSQTRQVIENAFAMLKTRFRGLMYLEVDIEHAAPIIKACCKLHNFSLRYMDRETTTAVPHVLIGGNTPAEKRKYIKEMLH